MRALLDALIGVLRHFASPTGARGSVLLMTGGLVVLGFLFLAFLFRSAIVGDLAPSTHAGAHALPRVRLPDPKRRQAKGGPFPADARAAARAAMATHPPTVDAVMEALVDHGCDARVLESGATRKRVRLYHCPSCDSGRGDCGAERAFLAGGFEALTGQLAKVDEVACRHSGARYCEFEVRHHASYARVRR